MPDNATEVTIHKNYTRVLIACDCKRGDPCPQGKPVTERPCQFWIERKNLTGQGLNGAFHKLR